MLGTDPRTLKIAWTLLLSVLALILLYQIRSIIIVFALALFLAHLLAPLVDLVVRLFAGKIHRTASLAIAYVIFIGVIVSLGILIGSPIERQASTLASRIRRPSVPIRWSGFHCPPGLRGNGPPSTNL